MNKLSFKTVEDLFLQANPEGAIWQTTASNKGHYAVSVAFKSDGKVYEYKVKNYVQLVEKLKLSIKLMYQREYDSWVNQIEKLEAEIKKGYYESSGFFEDEGTEVRYTDEELISKRININCYRQKIAGVTLI